MNGGCFGEVESPDPKAGHLHFYFRVFKGSPLFRPTKASDKYLYPLENSGKTYLSCLGVSVVL